MLSKFNWISIEDVIELNFDAVLRTGEPHILLDQQKLQAALARPQTLCVYQEECDTLTLSVSHMISIAQSHAFIQGNKRTGFAAGHMFMQNNGYDFTLPDTDEIADFFTEVILNPSKVQMFQTHLEQFVVIGSDE